MKILSVRQPYAWLIVNGYKDVENRSWPTNFRGRLLIHASQRADNISADEIERRYGVRVPSDLALGGVVGMATIVDCRREHASRWAAPGHWHFVLAGSRPLPYVKWRGSLGLRDAPRELLDLLELQSAYKATSSGNYNS